MTKGFLFGFILALVTYSMLSSSCNRKEGCLDPNSTNYTIDAESNCCCEFPFLRLNVGYKVGEENLVLGDTFQNDLGVQITVENFAIYLSSFSLSSLGEEVAQVENRLQLPTTEIVDDIVLLKRADFNYALGTFNQTSNFNKIEFAFGLPSNLSPIDFSELLISENHPLAIQEDSLYNEETQEFDHIFLSLKMDGLFFEIRWRPEILLSFDNLFETSLGSDLIVPMEIDFAKLLKDIDSSMDIDQIQTIINQNVDNSVQIL